MIVRIMLLVQFLCTTVTLASADQPWVWVITKFPGYLHQIQSVGLDTLFIADTDYLLRSTNQGRSWEKYRYSNTGNANIRTISFPTSLIGYAAGNHVYKTTNGGQSWDSLLTSYRNKEKTLVYPFYSSWFHDQFNGVIVGETKRHTSNGGQSFDTLFMEIMFPWCTQFVSRDLGYSVGWTNQFVGSVGTILRTTDGGLMWEYIFSKDLFRALFKFALHAVHFPSERVGWVGGERYPGNTDYPNARVLRTLDSGQTFDTISQVFPHTVNCIEFVSEQVGFIGDDKGWLFTTTDGGERWTIDSTSGLGLAIYDFGVAGNVVYACGESGLLLKREVPTSVDAETTSHTRTTRHTLHVCPNPTTGACTVVLPETLSPDEPLDVTVVDVGGRVVDHIQTIGNTCTINLSPLPCGTYMVRATRHSTTWQAVVVVE